MGTARVIVVLLAGWTALASGLSVPEPATQNPLGATRNDATPYKVNRPWDASPSDSEASNLIFFRLATLLQHWPNTRYPSGQSVVPGTIPTGTTLYHGWRTASVPTTPDWLAFDPEHSMVFSRGSDSRLFTFITTRPLRVLYFDGSGAAKLSSGATDTQDLLAWGKTGNDPMREERQLINDLCEWGKELGIDGYVRMEMSFEVMYCDFSQGLGLVSSIHPLPSEENESPPKVPKIPLPFPNEPRPPNWKGALQGDMSRIFEIFQAGAWHNRAPGEVRVKIDAARLVSLYDPALQSALAARRGKEKVLHRGNGLTEDDISTWRDWVKHVAHKDAPPTSGVDWPALTTVIMDRYGGRLEYLQFLLHPDRVSRNATAAVQDVRSHLMVMLATDITADTVPPDNKAATSSMRLSQIRQEAQNHTWVEPIARRCSSFVVSHLPKTRFTREERTLHAAVSGTQAEICRVLALMWSEAYEPIGGAEDMLEEWRGRVDGLMRWLDWPMWNWCKPECSLDTMCFIPTWPMGMVGPKGLDEIDWTPKCIPRGKVYF